MAARRARLQIKPNIGGPKVPAVKSTANKKPAMPVATQVEPVKETTPTPAASCPSEDIADKGLDKLSDNVSAITKPEKTGQNNDKEDNAQAAKLLVKETNSEDSTNTNDMSDTLTSPPTRARIRRFGKVNLAAITGDKAQDKEKDDTTKLPTQQKADSVLDKSDLKTDDKHTPKTSVDSEATEKAVSDAKSQATASRSTSPSITRRSRFPKAKPNIADASKRKQRPSEEKGEDSSKGSTQTTTKKALAVPSIVVTPSEEPSTSEESTSSATTDKPDGQMTQIQMKPPTPRSPMKLPVRPPVSVSPIKQAHGSDKRQRTVSVSEAPAPKRPKRPKVDAPTDKPADRSTMRMRDLIHWNPKNNPMKPKVKAPTGEVVVGKMEKENVVKDVADPAPPLPATPTLATPPPISMDISEDSNSSMPVPQLTIGPDGNIIINEKSLVVDNPDAGKGSADEDGIIDETDMITTYHSFRKMHKSKKWSKRETAKFYKALAMIGIDFTMIEKLFPKRTRQDIKKKFKIEERKNKSLVDKILTESIRFDPTIFEATEEELESSSEDEEEKQKKAKNEKKKPGRKKKEKVPTDEPPKPRKKPTKRKKKPLNYFEDSHSENEDTEQQKNTAVSEDTAWQPACVSGKDKDGEVVGILMDMSEGRLSSDGTPVPVGNTFQPTSSATGPARTNIIPGIQNIITLQTQKGPRKIAPRPAVTGQPTGVQLNTNRLSRPGISALASQNVQSGTNNALNPSVTEGAGNTRVVLNNMPSGALRTSPVVESNQHIVTEHVPSLVDTNQSALPQGYIIEDENQPVYQPVQGETTNYGDDWVIQTAQDTSQMQAGQEEQYVLVTVVPEGGEETVIHIYKLHGGAMTQDSVEGFAQNLNVSLNGSGGTTIVENT